MANLQTTKTPMPEQEANVRNGNFLEVALGYTLEQAQKIGRASCRERV